MAYWTHLTRLLLALGDVKSTALPTLPSLPSLGDLADSSPVSTTRAEAGPAPATFSKFADTLLDDMVRAPRCAQDSHANRSGPTRPGARDERRGWAGSPQLGRSATFGARVTTLMVESLNPLAVPVLFNQVRCAGWSTTACTSPRAVRCLRVGGGRARGPGADQGAADRRSRGRGSRRAVDGRRPQQAPAGGALHHRTVS